MSRLFRKFRSKRGYRTCSKGCDMCEGNAYIECGDEGFVNGRIEQDVRARYRPCPNSDWEEPDWDTMPGGKDY